MFFRPPPTSKHEDINNNKLLPVEIRRDQTKRLWYAWLALEKSPSSAVEKFNSSIPCPGVLLEPELGLVSAPYGAGGEYASNGAGRGASASDDPVPSGSGNIAIGGECWFWQEPCFLSISRKLAMGSTVFDSKEGLAAARPQSYFQPSTTPLPSMRHHPPFHRCYCLLWRGAWPEDTAPCSLGCAWSRRPDRRGSALRIIFPAVVRKLLRANRMALRVTGRLRDSGYKRGSGVVNLQTFAGEKQQLQSDGLPDSFAKSFMLCKGAQYVPVVQSSGKYCYVTPSNNRSLSHHLLCTNNKRPRGAHRFGGGTDGGPAVKSATTFCVSYGFPGLLVKSREVILTQVVPPPSKLPKLPDHQLAFVLLDMNPTELCGWISL